MTFYNVRKLTVLIVLKLTYFLSKMKREAVFLLPYDFTSQLGTSRFS